MKHLKFKVEQCILYTERVEKRRRMAEEGLRKTTNKYDALVLQHAKLLEKYEVTAEQLNALLLVQ